MYYFFKIMLSALILVALSELSKINKFWATILMSLPTVSILTFIWIYIETKDIEKIAVLSTGIFWLMIPSTVFFILLPILLKLHINFWLAISIACLATSLGYFLMLKLSTWYGFSL